MAVHRSLKAGLALGMVVLLLCALGLACIQQNSAQAANVHSLQQRKQDNQQRIARLEQLKRQVVQKEQYVTSHIVHNQQRLEASKSSLQAQQHQMKTTQVQLGTLESSMDTVLAEQRLLSQQVGRRLRSFYMGEKIGLLNILLDAGNLPTMMDRLYYKQKIMAQDKRLVKAYLDKTAVLEEKKGELAVEKNRLTQTIQQIHTYQGQLQESMTVDKVLVNKLKTSKEAYDTAETQLERESHSIEQQILQATRSSSAVVFGSTGIFMAPVFAAVTSTFGYRFHPIFHTRRFHSGLDFGAHYGSPVRAADGGTVLAAGWQGGYGKTVIINHGSRNGSNVATLYGHMSGLAVGQGQHVQKGQVVGYVGSTGYSTGPHLHFEVRLNGRPVNPMGFLR